MEPLRVSFRRLAVFGVNGYAGTALDPQRPMPALYDLFAADANRIVRGDNLTVLREFPAGSIDLVYADPPFNTGRSRKHQVLRTTQPAAGENGDRTGFGGRRYTTEVVGESVYSDTFDDYLAFLAPRLEACWRVLKDTGSLYLHLDWREVHYAKVLCDELFGRDRFLNEIIWAYDFGGRGSRKWPAKHDTILVYVKDPKRHWFSFDEVERIPYLAPGLVGKEKAARGKTPTDVWWHTIVPTAGREKTGYPTQKPLGVLRRVVAVSCPPGGVVLDPFAGSGTTGAAAVELGRRFVLVDNNPEAIAVMKRRFADVDVTVDDSVVDDAVLSDSGDLVQQIEPRIAEVRPPQIAAPAEDASASFVGGVELPQARRPASAADDPFGCGGEDIPPI